MKVIIILLSAALCSIQTIAQTEKYTLFNPVPRESMREFSLDRPDITESPITVDAGHFQFEGDIVKWVKNTQGTSEKTISIWSGLYKIGLATNWDIHVGYELYNIYQDTEGNKVDDGSGALFFRLKRNFWGNEGDSKTALGMIPYISFTSGKPFDKDEEIQFGVGFPFSYTLSDNLGLGAQPQIDFVPNGENGHDLSFFQTIVFGGALIGNLDFYLEALAVFANENQYLFDGGLIYNVTPNVKIDVATNIGLNDPAPTRVYLGLSFRI
jgi:hypothetical protein